MEKYKVGDLFPDITFKTAYKQDIHTKDILKGKTVFWVLRYIGCPVCRLDVTLIAKRYEEFREKGAQVFVVMQSDQEHIREALKDVELPYEIICDDDMKFYEQLHILPAGSFEVLAGKMNEEFMEKSTQAKEAGYFHGDYEGDELQLPALFIVDSTGKIEHAHYAGELMDMPDIDEVLGLL